MQRRLRVGRIMANVGKAACQRRAQVRDGYGYSSLRTSFLCGFQICKPCRSIT
jgi:hypothetical protein